MTTICGLPGLEMFFSEPYCPKPPSPGSTSILMLVDLGFDPFFGIKFIFPYFFAAAVADTWNISLLCLYLLVLSGGSANLKILRRVGGISVHGRNLSPIGFIILGVLKVAMAT